MRRDVPWWMRLVRPDAGRSTSLHGVRTLAKHLRDDPRIEGVAFVVPKLQAGWTVCGALRQAIADLRASNKQTAVLLTHGGGNKELYVASAADRVFTTPQATWMPLGLSVRAQYVRPLLARVGIEIEPFARKEYKTAAERATRDDMSPAQREQLTAILQVHQEELERAVAQRVDGDRERVSAIFERGFWTAAEAHEAGWVDGLGYEDELPALLGVAPPSPKVSTPPKRRAAKSPLVEGSAYLARKTARLFVPLRRPHYLAVISIKGAIGESGSPTGRRESLVAALRAVRRDRRALGLLLWVDSPGGSAEASDLIHREVARVKERKPVVAYFGDVAASGGYYVAACADEIIAHPLTLTGSIGVVSARLVAMGLFDKLGTRTEVVQTTPHADVFSPHRRLSAEERAMFDRQLDAFYDSFVGIVAEGRARPATEIEPLARGRVWIGRTAMDQALVDRLGGMWDAADRLRERVSKTWSGAVARLELRLVQPKPFATAPAPQAIDLVRSVSPAAATIVEAARGGASVLYQAVELPEVE